MYLYAYQRCLFSHSWSLWAVLTSLGYDHSHPSKLAELHISFAAELEACGAWQWAVFVVLHLDDAERKESVLLEVLCRQCSSSEELEEKELFVIEKLQLSPSFVYFAKVCVCVCVCVWCVCVCVWCVCVCVYVCVRVLCKSRNRKLYYK